ncbi:hypothetical protein [Carboxylicivirga linearis]|uniref:DUF4369 domain-containing protein n=1 Tax=Carboxylicivirga linearis TaxID=1628157 RepID=A0ABS5K1Y7_9BACT|nr:hypothetical protein [Carboxylicivirga linearis]MBS2100689.1 hypothetical protein [Carboxylicivirga linearis]
MTDYLFYDEATKTEIIATYTKGGKLKKVTTKKGVLQLDGLEYFIPCSEDKIDTQFLKIIVVSPDEFFKHAQKVWFEFYTYDTGLDYLFGAKDGNALKAIGKQLTKLTGSTETALDAFKYITKHWNQLDPFYRNNKDLTFINSQLNKILNLLKNGKQTGTAAQSHTADDLRRGFQS